MRGRRPALLCDGDDGECGAWDVDYWTETASMVNGIRITSTRRAPGWVSTDDGDWCREHAQEATA